MAVLTGVLRPDCESPALAGDVRQDTPIRSEISGTGGVQQAKEKGEAVTWRKEPVAVEVQELKSLTQSIEGVADRKIVYVGENHDKSSHHAVELEALQALFRKDPKLAVGMEMFQRPFQSVIDAYIGGRIEEREFLKRTEYFDRWGFDYNLYKPILDFARTEKIPVVALNIRREIVEKVGREGTAALTEGEKKEIPADMDYTDTAYRERVEKVFKEHEGMKEKNFDFFFQAQVLWDETMAMSIDEYLKKEPGRRMVVFAGQGHVAYGSGIPKRALRRNGLPYGILLNDADPDRDIGTYVVYPPEVEGKTAPRLMVLLKQSNERVTITGLPDNSVSAEAGLKSGDVILALDGEPVRMISDIKLALFYKKSGDTIRVTAVRKGFFWGERALTIDVKLR